VTVSVALVAMPCEKAGEVESGHVGHCGLGPENSDPFYLFEKFSDRFELIRLNSGLPEFEKFQINYG
jgi:hypothetical protein